VSLSPSWPIVGIALILIGLVVDFEVRVLSSEENEEIERNE
tara:strand:+ start:1284 stop:1406 length:123 start_codon:yes stop_codon:yes gene_type:complete